MCPFGPRSASVLEDEPFDRACGRQRQVGREKGLAITRTERIDDQHTADRQGRTTPWLRQRHVSLSRRSVLNSPRYH